MILLEPAEAIQTCFEQGERLANQGLYSEALIQFDRIIEAQSDSVPVWVFRAVVLLHLVRYQEALESCNRALVLCPTDAEALLFRGVALHRLNRYREAYRSYETALGDRSKSKQQSLQVSLPSPDHGNWLKSLRQSLRQSFKGWA